MLADEVVGGTGNLSCASAEPGGSEACVDVSGGKSSCGAGFEGVRASSSECGGRSAVTLVVMVAAVVGGRNGRGGGDSSTF